MSSGEDYVVGDDLGLNEIDMLHAEIAASRMSHDHKWILSDGEVTYQGDAITTDDQELKKECDHAYAKYNALVASVPDFDIVLKIVEYFY